MNTRNLIYIASVCSAVQYALNRYSARGIIYFLSFFIILSLRAGTEVCVNSFEACNFQGKSPQSMVIIPCCCFLNQEKPLLCSETFRCRTGDTVNFRQQRAPSTRPPMALVAYISLFQYIFGSTTRPRSRSENVLK